MNPTLYAASAGVSVYDPPIEEFSVLHVKCQGDDVHVIKAIEGPSVGIVTTGSGFYRANQGEWVSCVKGTCLYVDAGTCISYKGDKDGMQVYQAYCALAE